MRLRGGAGLGGGPETGELKSLGAVCLLIKEGYGIAHQPPAVIWHLAELVRRGLIENRAGKWHLTEAGQVVRDMPGRTQDG